MAGMAKIFRGMADRLRTAALTASSEAGVHVMISFKRGAA
jgi:hypothetical protein